MSLVYSRATVELALATQPGVVRDIVFGSHIIRYAAQAEPVVALRIWHHLQHERDRENIL
jgi:hypothetical protein